VLSDSAVTRYRLSRPDGRISGCETAPAADNRVSAEPPIPPCGIDETLVSAGPRVSELARVRVGGVIRIACGR